MTNSDSVITIWIMLLWKYCLVRSDMANCFLLDNDREKLGSFARRATKKNNLEIEHRANKLTVIINKLTVMMEMKIMVIELIMMVILMATR